MPVARSKAMRILHVALAAALLGVPPPVDAAPKSCAAELAHVNAMIQRKADATKAKNEAQDAVNKARFALDQALKKARTYDADLAKAKADVERFTRDTQECHARRKDNPCTWQESRKRNAEDRLANLLANPPSKTIPEAEQKLERAKEKLALAEELVRACERAIEEARAAHAKCLSEKQA